MEGKEMHESDAKVRAQCPTCSAKGNIQEAKLHTPIKCPKCKLAGIFTPLAEIPKPDDFNTDEELPVGFKVQPGKKGSPKPAAIIQPTQAGAEPNNNAIIQTQQPWLLAAVGVGGAIIGGVLVAFFIGTKPADTVDHKSSLFQPTEAGSAIATVENYLSAKHWTQRIPFVLDTQNVQPLMEARYGTVVWDKNPIKYTILTQSIGKPLRSGHIKVEASVNGKYTVYHLKKNGKTYLIDWLASVGSNLMSPEEFQATKPKKDIRLRVWASLASYYNYNFRGLEKTHYSIKIEEGAEVPYGHGYIEKSSTQGKLLLKKLKHGNKHKLVVDVKCPKNAKRGDLFLITKVVNDSGWVY